ncbi:unnamed protein product [Adineta ricciae]|uniref:Transmembrane protein 14C n=1 Tax=Adineta ricciae TaxID=249248 RepID=A0A815V8A7_ADIRI|nr:unnamed protein product [Adineta ricciae]CAF1531349.1 unnamed protein product [Adineta ricciae]
MTDQLGIAYGGALVVGGLLGYLRGASIISLFLGVVLGAWTIYNATRPSRQNNIANLAIAVVLGVVMLIRFLISGKVFPALVIVVLSAGQVYRNMKYLK